MTETRLSILKAATILLLCSTPGIAQPSPAVAPAAQASVPAVPVQPALPKQPPSLYRNLIVIDPAHGGQDRGAQLPNGAAEKDVTLAFAQRLRPALVAQGFTVVSTRDSDPADVLEADQRAGTANHNRPLACLILHATATGSGIHLATSSLERPAEGSPRVLRWSDAQAGALDMSLRLANEIGLALSNARLPVVLMRASVPPIDNITGAAAVIEIAPLAVAGGHSSSMSDAGVSDAGYQQRVAEAIAAGLASFRTHNAPAPTSATAPLSAPARPTPAPAVKPAPVAAPPQTDQKPAPPAQKQGAPR